MRRLKEIGSNAYRCAHNAPAAEIYDACDRQGMLVMDEKIAISVSSPELLQRLDWMVRRDRNHPSVDSGRCLMRNLRKGRKSLPDGRAGSAAW